MEDVVAIDAHHLAELADDADADRRARAERASHVVIGDHEALVRTDGDAWVDAARAGWNRELDRVAGDARAYDLWRRPRDRNGLNRRGRAQRHAHAFEGALDRIVEHAHIIGTGSRDDDRDRHGREVRLLLRARPAGEPVEPGALDRGGADPGIEHL